jgi:hypothetical protein
VKIKKINTSDVTANLDRKEGIGILNIEGVVSFEVMYVVWVGRLLRNT